jgi:hypothetical protein
MPTWHRSDQPHPVVPETTGPLAAELAARLPEAYLAASEFVMRGHYSAARTAYQEFWPIAWTPRCAPWSPMIWAFWQRWLPTTVPPANSFTGRIHTTPTVSLRERTSIV